MANIASAPDSFSLVMGGYMFKKSPLDKMLRLLLSIYILISQDQNAEHPCDYILIIHVMLAYGAVFAESLEGIAVLKPPDDYTLYGVNAVAVDIVLQHHAVVV